MVKLLDEFPNVHQTFNLVPSLITQIQDYVNGEARDPFLDVAAKPATDLTLADRHFALQYLFQANPVNMIGRYPRYRELWDHFRNVGGSPEAAEKFFQPHDFTDLQVLSQIAWFDEFFLDDRDIAELIRKGRGYSLEDQRFVIAPGAGIAGKSSASPCRSREARQYRDFNFRVLSPDSAIGLRYQYGRSFHARSAVAAEPFSPSRGRSRAISARA